MALGDAFARRADDNAGDGGVLEAVAGDGAGDEGLHSLWGFSFGADDEAGGCVDGDLQS